jgi:diguanylate cyclase (GGDEF)-like protein
MFYGWNLGFQCLLYCALLLILFNPGFSVKQKKTACISAILVLIFMEVFILLLSTPKPLNENAMFRSTQILLVNELFFLFSICMIGLTVASVSQQAEYLLMQNNRKLRDDAGTDPLTGLSNRRATELWFTDVISTSQELITLAMGDIDFFKKVNDTYGHDAGDFVLKGIAELLKDLINDQCYAARWGGEEFLLIFLGKNGDDVYTVLNSFLIRLRKHDFVYKDTVINVTMTFGIAEYDATPGIEGTIQEADEKLYFGKQRGRNCVIF